VVIDAQNYKFTPKNLSVKAGTTVKVVVSDGSHTWTGGSWDSGNLDTGQSYSFTFTTPGTYNYVCNYHASTFGMKGTITVTA
jgi:plastocyanin